MEFLNKVPTFLQEVRAELRRVNWPSRGETIKYTAFVIGFSAVIAMLLGVLDFLYMTIIRTTIIR